MRTVGTAALYSTVEQFGSARRYASSISELGILPPIAAIGMSLAGHAGKRHAVSERVQRDSVAERVARTQPSCANN